jgi:hypothetical protein
MLWADSVPFWQDAPAMVIIIVAVAVSAYFSIDRFCEFMCTRAALRCQMEVEKCRIMYENYEDEEDDDDEPDQPAGGPVG